MTMSRFLAIVSLCCMGASPSLAVTAQTQTAIKALSVLEADQAKVDTLCKLNKALEDAGEDQAKVAVADKQMDAFLDTLGADAQLAFDLADELDPASEDGKALEEAFERLEAKCPQ